MRAALWSWRWLLLWVMAGLLLWAWDLSAIEARTVVTLPCMVEWGLLDARHVVAFRLYRHGAGEACRTGSYVRQVDTYASPTWAQLYQASCAAFGLSRGLHTIAVSVVQADGRESPRSPTLLLEVQGAP